MERVENQGMNKKELLIYFGVLTIAMAILGFAIGFGFAIHLSQTEYWESRFSLLPLFVILTSLLICIDVFLYGKKCRKWLYG